MQLLQSANIENMYNKISDGATLDLTVTYYQRPYRWPQKRIIDLFEDFFENKRKSHKASDKDYFFRAVVLVDDNSNENERSTHIKLLMINNELRHCFCLVWWKKM